MIHQIKNPEYKYIVEEGTTGNYLCASVGIVSDALKASVYISESTAKTGITKHNQVAKRATWLHIQPINNPQIRKFAIKSWELI